MAGHAGQQLGNYTLVRKLGEGGFAEVYLAEQIHLGTQAAIKLLHTQLSADTMDEFRTEARTIARLIHPNIVRVLEFGIEDKTPFLVMDFASNGTLRQKHPRGVVLSLNIIVSYVKQLASALQYAHDERLIHRDVKPENMLIGRRGEVLLSDFGIALVAQSSRYQSTQDMVGTMAYMAPEQIQGKPRPASDQYALAIVVYEWLCGTRPFHGAFTEIVAQHLAAPPPPLHVKVPTIPRGVENVVMTALAKDPKARFVSIQAFAKALEQASQTDMDMPTFIKSPSAVATRRQNEEQHPPHIQHIPDVRNQAFQTARAFSQPMMMPPISTKPSVRTTGTVRVILLWALAVFLGVTWLVGFFVLHIGGFLIHTLLISAISCLILSLAIKR